MKNKLIALTLACLFALTFTITGFADVEPPWTENVEARNETSLHFQIWTVDAIASALLIKFGGAKGAYYAIAKSYVVNNVISDTQNVHYTVRYYWQPSGDPQQQYKIKQVIYSYSDKARTDFIGVTTNYYLSNITQ